MTNSKGRIDLTYIGNRQITVFSQPFPYKNREVLLKNYKKSYRERLFRQKRNTVESKYVITWKTGICALEFCKPDVYTVIRYC